MRARRLGRFVAMAWLGALPVRAGAPTPEALLDQLQGAWDAHDPAAYLALWDAPAPEAETAFAAEYFAPGREGRLVIERRLGASGATGRRAVLQTFVVREPRAALESWTVRLDQGAQGWRLVERTSCGRFDVVHLGLDPGGRPSRGLTLRLPDFELAMGEGTLFTSPATLGPTVLVFVGEGTVRFRPGSETERDQLRLFAGRRELEEPVRAAFVRLHPADLTRVLGALPDLPDPAAPRRLRRAMEVYRTHAPQALVLDADLPRAPWWVLPAPGDALVTFETPRHVLSYAVNRTDPEAVSLFERATRRQICRYAPEGARRWSEDEGRAVDVVSHDLRLRVDPVTHALSGEDTVRLRLLSASGAVQLRLAEGLQVESVVSAAGGHHPCLRVRHQDRVIVALGPLAYTVGEVSLTIRYAGILEPGAADREAAGSLENVPPWIDVQQSSRELLLQEILTYSCRDAWYPQGAADDYATARLRVEVPEGFAAVGGGELGETRTADGRRFVEYVQERPVKYLTLVVGRLVPLGTRLESGVTLEALSVPRLRGDGARALDLAQDILHFLVAEYGPCPYPTVRLVLSEHATPGGHSGPGLVLLSHRPALLPALVDDPARLSREPGFFLAHELAHQWWGHGVSGENYHERWISEAFAQYAAAAWVRQRYGEGEFQSVLRRAARWAQRRADKGPISLGQRLGQVDGDPQAFRAVVYDKGACVLHMLEVLVGPQAFRAALRRVQEEHRFQKIGTDDLREALEQASGQALESRFRAWVEGTEVPRLQG